MVGTLRTNKWKHQLRYSFLLIELSLMLKLVSVLLSPHSCALERYEKNRMNLNLWSLSEALWRSDQVAQKIEEEHWLLLTWEKQTVEMYRFTAHTEHVHKVCNFVTIHSHTVVRWTVFPPTHWCSWLPGFNQVGVKKRGLAGHVSKDAWLKICLLSPLGCIPTTTLSSSN